MTTNKIVPRAQSKLLFVVTEDWYFCSHRLPVALAALAEGREVALAANIGIHGEALRAAGIQVYPWFIRRGSTSVWSELRSLFSLMRIYLRYRPDIVHHVAIKPVLYGSLVAGLTGVGKIVNALGGMGALFTGDGGRKQRLRAHVMRGFRWLLARRSTVLILQNPQDRSLMVQDAGIDPRSIRMIRGGGVNLKEFAVTPEPAGIPCVVLPARMLADKGVGEFVEAARLLRAQGIGARFVLAGGVDLANPAAIGEAQLLQWVEEGAVEWLGRSDHMPAVLASAAVVCLPSYREGLPKALLEAAACGRAIVTTDVPGCREVVRHGINGLLVPARDAVALAEALRHLLEAPEARAAMGARGREIALGEFSEELVVEQTLAIYRDLEAGRT